MGLGVRALGQNSDVLHLGVSQRDSPQQGFDDLETSSQFRSVDVTIDCCPEEGKRLTKENVQPRARACVGNNICIKRAE